jgi:hypothetical protein
MNGRERVFAQNEDQRSQAALMRTVPLKRTPLIERRTLIWCLASSLSVLVAPTAMAQDRGLAIEYTVKVADIPGQLFHVTTDISNINQPRSSCRCRSGRPAGT